MTLLIRQSKNNISAGVIQRVAKFTSRASVEEDVAPYRWV